MTCITDAPGIEGLVSGAVDVFQLLAAENDILTFLRGIWNSIDINFAYQVYFVVGVASITVMFFWVILNVLGFGSGADAIDAVEAGEALSAADAVDGLDAADAADAGEAADSSASIFTFRSLLAFFGGFGWSGVLALEAGLSTPMSFLVSIPVGLFFFLLTYGVLLFLLTMSASGALDYKNAIGETGEVYLSIPPNRSGSGKIRVKVQGRLKTVSAYNAGEREAEMHSRVRVIDQIDSSTLLVKPLGEENDRKQEESEPGDPDG